MSCISKKENFHKALHYIKENETEAKDGIARFWVHFAEISGWNEVDFIRTL